MLLNKPTINKYCIIALYCKVSLVAFFGASSDFFCALKLLCSCIGMFYSMSSTVFCYFVSLYRYISQFVVVYSILCFFVVFIILCHCIGMFHNLSSIVFCIVVQCGQESLFTVVYNKTFS